MFSSHFCSTSFSALHLPLTLVRILWLFNLWLRLLLFLGTLVRGKYHDKVATLELHGLIDLSDISDLPSESVEHLPALILISDLPSLEHDRCLHFVPFFDEPASMPSLEFEIMDVCVGMEPNLLYLRHMLMLSLKLLLLRQLVLVFPKVHNLADGGIGIRHNLNQIPRARPRNLKCFLWTHDAQLLSIIINHPHAWRTNLIVDPRPFSFDALASYVLTILLSISSTTRVRKSWMVITPRSPCLCRRTLTLFPVSSFLPSTSI
jgi:hypothetical protein